MELQKMCKAIRQQLHITQRQLAEKIGTTQTEISFIERGFVPPDYRKVKAIQELFKCL